MPKVNRNSNLSREARRRLATSDNLPLASRKKIGNADDGGSVQAKEDNALTPLKEKNLLEPNEGSDQKTGEIQNSIDTVAPKRQQLSRGQRKRQAKREQFLKKEKMILSSLMLQRQEEQKKRIDGLDAIKQALMDTSAKSKNDQNTDSSTKKAVQHVATNKAKRKLVAKEIEHVNLILQHPAFKRDPFETMQEHLRNTLAEDRKQHEMVSKKRTDEEKRKSESKRAEKNGIKRKSQKKKYKPRRTR